MTMFKVDDPVKMGRLVLALRYARNKLLGAGLDPDALSDADLDDALGAHVPNVVAREAYRRIVRPATYMPAKATELGRWSIGKKQRYQKEDWEDDFEPINGGELQVQFDVHGGAGDTVMAVPTKEDIDILWEIEAGIKEHPTVADLAELGSYILKKCR